MWQLYRLTVGGFSVFMRHLQAQYTSTVTNLRMWHVVAAARSRVPGRSTCRAARGCRGRQSPATAGGPRGRTTSTSLRPRSAWRSASARPSVPSSIWGTWRRTAGRRCLSSPPPASSSDSSPSTVAWNRSIMCRESRGDNRGEECGLG